MELSRLQRLACLATTGAVRTTPTATLEVLLGLPPLHVMTEAEAQAGIYRLKCSQQWKPKFTNLVMLQNLGTCSLNPSYGWGLTGWHLDTTSHSWSGSLTDVSGRTDSNWILKLAWSGTQLGLRPIKALVLGHTDGAREASVFGSNTSVFQAEIYTINACIMESTEKEHQYSF